MNIIQEFHNENKYENLHSMIHNYNADIDIQCIE